MTNVLLTFFKFLRSDSVFCHLPFDLMSGSNIVCPGKIFHSNLTSSLSIPFHSQQLREPMIIQVCLSSAVSTEDGHTLRTEKIVELDSSQQAYLPLDQSTEFKCAPTQRTRDSHDPQCAREGPLSPQVPSYHSTTLGSARHNHYRKRRVVNTT